MHIRYMYDLKIKLKIKKFDKDFGKDGTLPFKMGVVWTVYIEINGWNSNINQVL